VRTRPKRRQVGTAGLVYRYRNGTCVHECRACATWETFAGWRPAVHAARAHAIDHAAGRAHSRGAFAMDRYALAPKGIRAIGGGG
jgi:hypothetical protein